MNTMPLEIQAARLRLAKQRPYLAAALWSLVPVARPGLGTMAVDQWWRLYFDPAVATEWSVEELAGVLYHEVLHLLRDHPGRMRNLERAAANVAADAEVNDDLLAEGVRLPGAPITPASIGQPEGLLAEEYYAALAQRQRPAPDPGASAQPGNSGKSQEGPGGGEPVTPGTRQGEETGVGQGESSPADTGDATRDAAALSAPGGSRGDGSNSSPTAEGGSQADGSQPGAGGDASGSKAGDSGGSTHPPDSSAQPGASSRPSTGPVGNGRAGEQDGTASGGRVQTSAAPAPGAGRCGSCATGQQEPWEAGPPGSEDTPPGVGQAEAELIRREVALRIREASQSRGDIPAHLRRWAEEKLRPKADWRRILAAAIRRAIADVAGASDYTYRRPSRRQGQVGNGKVVLPALRRPVPEVAVVVDTSGSVSDAMLVQALAEVRGILEAAGQRQGVRVLAVDAAVQTCRRVFRPDQVELAGGGGTDMRVGLEAAAKMRPRPDIIVIVTDGFTPWPSEPPRGIRVIVAHLGDGGTVPAWAKEVKICMRNGRKW